jgi:SPOR domain
MADNTFRTTRRDAAARDAGSSGGQQFDDPLAELARLIGRNPPANQTPDQYETPVDAPQADPQWAADARHAEQHPDQQNSQYDDRQGQSDESQYSDGQYAEGQYGDGQYSERGEGQYSDRQYTDRDAPRFADPSPPYRQAPPSYNADYEPPDRYAAPQQHDARGYSDQPRYDDAHDPVQEVPAFLPRTREDRYGYAQQRGQDRVQDRAFDRRQDQAYEQGYDQTYGRDQNPDDYDQGYAQDHAESYEEDYPQAQEGDPDQSYALEDYEDEDDTPAPRRRGFAVAAALLGVIVLGTAGAFGYRAMFGGSMMPGLPPIIRADSTPNKIIPAGNSANASGQASANSASPDKLVSREERPVDVPAPPGTPRVVSTIPVFPDPNAGLQSSVVPGGQSMAGQNMAGAVASGAAPGGAMSLGPTSVPAYGGAGTAVPMPGPSAVSQSPPLQSPPVAGAGNAKKIHTVAIHAGQPDDSDAAASAPAPHAQPGRPAAPSRPVAAPQSQGGNSPMSIVPSQGDADTSRTRTAVARPASEPAPAAAPAGGGYFVQVSSQRSESDAQSAYRGLQAKFPSQLGGHEATIRQVDLGEKGTFFRTLVGPYATMEQAAQMCSGLKSAGGSCLVQRN